jgi:hypothetical protein
MKRLEKVIDVVLEFFDSEGNIISIQPTITDIVAHNGVCVLTYWPVEIAEILNVKIKDKQFESLAIVKSIQLVQLGKDKINRLILEFTGNEWQHTWIFAKQLEPSNLYFDDFIETAQETSMLLQIVLNDAESGEKADQLFLQELQANVDKLRSLIFLLKKA